MTLIGAWVDPSVDMDVAHRVQSSVGCFARSQLTTVNYYCLVLMIKLWSFNRSQSRNWLTYPGPIL